MVVFAPGPGMMSVVKTLPKTKKSATKSRVLGPLPDFRKRWEQMRALGYVPPTRQSVERFHRIIAGEE